MFYYIYNIKYYIYNIKYFCLQNAIEVFKEVLSKDPDHLDACTSLAQAFR